MLSRVRALAAALLVALAAGSAQAAPAWNFDWSGRVELDAQGLGSADENERKQAVNALAQYDPSLTAPHLLKALKDPEKGVRIDAARALGRGGVTSVTPLMIEWLADPSPEVRGVAADVLGDVGGDDATAALIRTLGDSDHTVRLRAVGGLGKIGQRGNAAVVVPLISRLEDDKSDVRRKAIEQLETLKDKRAVIPLVAVFGDTSGDVRKAAIRAVGQLGDPAAVSALLRLLHGPAEDERTLAVSALGALGAPEAADTLIDLLASGSDSFRARVAYAIGQIAARPDAGDVAQRAVRALVAALATPGQQRAAAREALAVAGKAAVPALIAHLGGKLAGDPITAVQLLRDAKDPRATAVLVAELERGRVPVPQILAALGATGDADALVPVLGTLGSKEPAVRLAAMEALRPLVGHDARAADVLIERLGDEDLEVRILAVEYLGLTHAKAAIPKLAALTQAGSPPRLRRAAIDALGEIGDARAAAALIALLREGPGELHRPTVDALSYIDDAKSIEALVTLTRDDRGPTRHHMARALGGMMRKHKDERGEKLLRQLAEGATTQVSLAAIAGLAAAESKGSTELLTKLVDKSSSDRRRAAAAALGELGAVDAVPHLVAALAAKDDRVVADAAWALGQIAARGGGSTAAVTKGDTLAILARVAKRGGWASSISASGALVRIALVDPAAVAKHRDVAVGLLYHRSRFVRVNGARLVAELERGASAPAAPSMSALVTLTEDPSPGVRLAALRALGTIAGGKPGRLGAAGQAALTASATQTRDPVAAKVAAAAKKAAPTYATRVDWRTFYMVDPTADDRPVREEAYVLLGSDQIAWATYTDARGEITTEHFPPGDAVILQSSHEDEF